MHNTLKRFIFLGALLPACLGLGGPATPAAAAILTVDCVAGPFLDIGPAVTAAGPGDTVVVHPCPVAAYSPFAIAGKDRVHVMAAESPAGPTGAVDIGVGVPTSFTSPVVVSGLAFPGLNCLTIDSSRGVTVTNIAFVDCQVTGIFIVNSAKTTLVGNRLARMRAVGIMLSGGEDNHILGNFVSRARADAILIELGDETVIADNVLIGNARTGIFMASGAGFNTQIVNNLVRSNRLEGMIVAGVETRVMRNTVAGNLLAGGVAEIVIDALAVDPDIAGNDTGGALSIVDFSGTAELADNL